jgi:methionine biosynthesis protein MetW
MRSLKNLLKRCIPWGVRRQRYAWKHVRNEVLYHLRPAPMTEFADYDEYWNKRPLIDEPLYRWVIAAPLIDDGASLLDVGCGTGGFLQQVRKARPNVHCKGIDFSERAIEIVRSLGFDAEKGDVAIDPIVGQFDFVSCFEVLEHIPDAEAALGRLKAAFRKKLLLSVPNVGYWLCRVRLMFVGRSPLTNCQLHVKEHVRFWTVKEFREWIAAHGMKVVRIYGQSGTPWTPWKKWPSLFANATVYIIQHDRDGREKQDIR